MLKTLDIPPAGFDDLPIDAQIDFVQSLWDRIATNPNQVAVPGWHRRILKERLKDLDSSPEDGVTWEELRDRLESQLSSGEK